MVMVVVVAGVGTRRLQRGPGDEKGQGLGYSKYTWRKKKKKQHCKLDIEPLSLASQAQKVKNKYLY